MINFQQHPVYFISGIDTDIGKTYCTGLLARYCQAQAINCITQKLVQTGVDSSDLSKTDIGLHRQIMQRDFYDADQQGLTLAQCFDYPASPHLAAKQQQQVVNIAAIDFATNQLKQQFELILLEGAGGLMVPLNNDLLIIDYIQQRDYPVILVTSGRLGAINHTLLSLNALQQRNIKLFGLAFNHYPAQDPIINEDSVDFLKKYLASHFPASHWFDIPKIEL